ncbi:MAG: hypothetical protein KDJ47_03420 [Hyphomicrobiaceae bacterium]|nr:hypothetical protein [Hyphomicrobiaceae bacterium]
MAQKTNFSHKVHDLGSASSDAGSASGDIMAADTLAYVSDMIDELRDMTQRSGLHTLAGILALARMEAEAQYELARRNAVAAGAMPDRPIHGEKQVRQE